MLTLLTFLGWHRPRPVADDLDTALAGAQISLERRRRQWLLWLVEEKRAPLLARQAANSTPASPAVPPIPPPEQPGDAP